MINANTCGGKSKEFTWKIGGENIVINRPAMKNKDEIISLDIFLKINAYTIQKTYINLCNSVSKMADGTEKDGIGTFLMSEFDFKSSDAQIASQIAAILCQTGCWVNNGKQRNIEFYSKTDDPITLIKQYYEKHKNGDEI